MNTSHQNTALSRRTVAKGALWTAPAISLAAAAPAVAASSSCVSYTGAFTQPSYSPVRMAYTFTGSDGSTVTVSLSTRVYGGKTLMRPNLSAAGNIEYYNGAGDLRYDGLQLQQQGTGGQVLTFSFSQEVSNLQFTVADIDNDGTRYRDSIVLSPAPTTVTNGRAVVGAGTTAAPLRTTGTSQVTSDTLANRSTVTMADPLSSFSLDFSSSTGTTAQQIFITSMSFDVC